MGRGGIAAYGRPMNNEGECTKKKAVIASQVT